MARPLPKRVDENGWRIGFLMLPAESSQSPSARTPEGRLRRIEAILADPRLSPAEVRRCAFPNLSRLVVVVRHTSSPLVELVLWNRIRLLTVFD